MPPTSEAAIRPPSPVEDRDASSPPAAGPDFAGAGDEPWRGGDWVWGDAVAGFSDVAEEDALAEEAVPGFEPAVAPDEDVEGALAAVGPDADVAGFDEATDALAAAVDALPAAGAPPALGLAVSPGLGAAEAACEVVAPDALVSAGFASDADAPGVAVGLVSLAFAEAVPAEEPGACSPGFACAVPPALPVPEAEPDPGVAGLDDAAPAETGASPAFPAFTSLASRSIVTGLRCEPPAGLVAPLEDAVFGSGFLLSAAMDGLSLAVMRPSVRAFRRRGGLAVPAPL